MSYGGFILDMIKRNKEDRDNLKRIREKREGNGQIKYSSRIPDMSAEDFEKILSQTKEREQQQERYFLRTTLYIVGILILLFILAYAAYRLFGF